MLLSLDGRRWRFLWGMLLQQQIASSSPNYELLKFTSVHCLIQSLLQWSPIAILFVAYLHRYLHIHGDSFLKSYQTYMSHGISPLAPSSPCRIYDSFTLPNLYQMSPYVKGQLWWGALLEICLNEPDRVGNWRGILQQQQEIMQILQNQAFFFEKGRQDILPHCNDISDNEAQVTLQ